MPWRTTPIDERLRFVQDVHRPGWSIAELCRRYEVSRKTGYKRNLSRSLRHEGEQVY